MYVKLSRSVKIMRLEALVTLCLRDDEVIIGLGSMLERQLLPSNWLDQSGEPAGDPSADQVPQESTTASPWIYP